MSDNPRKDEPRAPEPEPEDGPQGRREAFLEERTARLRPRGPEDEVEAESEGAAPTRREGVQREPLPKDFRRELVARYRAAQETQLDQAPTPRSREGESGRPRSPGGEGDAADAEPPQPPSPPPANNWIPIGPSVVREGQGGTKPPTSGRILGFAVGTGGNPVYAASSNGGVWRSDDAGASWRSLMDAWDLNPANAASDSLSCGAIAIDPANSNRIFVGSGDGDEAMFFGVGPVVSIDGGANWATEAVAPGSPPLAGSSFNALAVDPGNPDRVVAGTFLGLYRREPNGAGGFHWARKATPAGLISSVVVARTGTTTTFLAAPTSGPVYSSSDGSVWTVVGTGFPAGAARVGLAVRAGDPNVVYALVAAGDGSLLGIYRLDNLAGAWRQISSAPADLFGTAAIGFQGWYDLAVAVDPNDANRIYVGGSTKASAGEWSGCSYRCSVTSAGSGAGLTYSMTKAYIGNSHHADVHALVFAPGDSNKLWLGCDGGAFYSTNPTGAGDVFTPRNTGLQTLEMNKLGQHPTEDAVVFCGTQDNGGVRFTGEEAWYHSVWGDSGEFVINWNDPYRVLATYVRYSINRATDGGTRYNYSDVSVSQPAGDSALFYAPLAGTPPSATPAQAERVAFGSSRPWISETFGGGWQSIPSNAASDDLGAMIRCLVFASYDRLYAGTMGGRVYRFDKSAAAWTSTRIDNVAAGPLGLVGPITSIAVDAADATGKSIYITLGGTGDWRHVWHFNGTQWQQRSGPAAGNTSSLLDVQHSAIVCDPANPSNVYVGADIGVWRSINGGANWTTFSAGLPDAAVLDLDLHGPRRLLRAATYGRGVFEYDLAATSPAGIQLYVRDTQLDQGRFTTVDWLPDPTAQGELVRHWAGPDIKLDTPDVTGSYQFPIAAGTIDFEQFDEELNDDYRNVATHATATIMTRVYVQVHNRGVLRADNVRVMLLLANASAGLPSLPAGFASNVQSGTPISTASWKTVGFATLNDIRVGFPKIAAFDLTSNLLPPPASLAGNDHHCVLALVHHASDQFTAVETVTDLLSLGERKAAHKNLKVVQFTGTLPPAGAPKQHVVLPVRLHNPYDKDIVTTLRIDLGRFQGLVRVYLPSITVKGELAQLVTGAKPGKDLADFKRWAKQHNQAIRQNLKGKHPYDTEWCAQRIDDVNAAVGSKVMLVGAKKPRIELKEIHMKAGTHHTIFLLLRRPTNAKIGASYPIEIVQLDPKRKGPLGGLSARIDVVKAAKAPAPKATTVTAVAVG